MVQVDYLHGKSIFLPLAVGSLIACAKADPALDAVYDFKEPIFIREDPALVLSRIEEPYLVGFSNYIWNFEYNKLLARRIKEKYPDCIILFGGHQITADGAILNEVPYLDIAAFSEGEESFPLLLRALHERTPLRSVPNIAFRENGGITATEKRFPPSLDLPSPYLTGVYDSIFEHYPDLSFNAVIETVRGCPYACAYCDYGVVNCKVRAFSEERALAELRWVSEHGISHVSVADANFGMFARDERFVDEMVRLHNETGVLKNFQTSYAKNSNDRVFSITKKLNDCGMNKGTTLSFQSMDPTVLENIHRKNISVSLFTDLLKKYNEAGIATYSELILGLPGETVQTLVDGIDVLLDAGQHNAIYIHNCEWLPLADMGSVEYMKKHGLRTVRVPLNHPHRTVEENEIPEYSHIIIATDSMPPEDWVRMNIYSMAVQTFHHEGLLLFFALYLHDKQGMKYSDFYRGLIDFAFSYPQTVAGKIFDTLKKRFEAVTRAEEGLVCLDDRFGPVGWPPEEYAFLLAAYELDRFYDELRDFLSSYVEDAAVFEELFRYQREVMKLPRLKTRAFACEYDFKTYFTDLICGEPAELRRSPCRYRIVQAEEFDSWADYARVVVWYGRKDKHNFYLEELEKT